MIRLGIIIQLFVVLDMARAQEVTRQLQLQYPRVAEAFKEKKALLEHSLNEGGWGTAGYQVLLCAYKIEKKLEVFVKAKTGKKFLLFRSYDFCVLSGEPGPKRRQGDLQVPEGFYTIDRFNPSSNFHLSLGIDYPNASDRILGDKKNPGGDIFIHGNCVSVGCIPITDDLIKELYVLCVEAMDGGQKKIPVYLFPCKLEEGKVEVLERLYAHQPELISFWKNLKQGYEKWTTAYQQLNYTINTEGAYLFR